VQIQQSRIKYPGTNLNWQMSLTEFDTNTKPMFRLYACNRFDQVMNN